LPGFRLTLGFTVFYLTVIVLAPIAALALKALRLPWPQLWSLATNERALAAYRLSLGASLAAALINALFGSLLAWVLVRYQFPGRRLLDGLIDFPFALPTAVAGLTLANLFSAHGWLGQFLVPMGIKGAFTRLGVIIALTFVGLPFSVRTLQPVLETLDASVEEAAACLGAGRFRTFINVIAPTLLPTILTGFGLSFARALGEYGSIVFISGNLPKTEIAPTLIVMRLNEYDYTGAIAVALVLMIFSFALLMTLNMLQAWAANFQEA
jgi:sulfate transport system permease protein